MKILWIVVLSGLVIAALSLFGIALFLVGGGLSHLNPKFSGGRSGELGLAGMLCLVILSTLIRAGMHYKRYVVDR